VDLPEPETPDKQTSRWRGSEKLKPARLCLVTLVKRSQGVRGIFDLGFSIFDGGRRRRSGGGLFLLQLPETGDGGAILFRVLELAVERSRPGRPGRIKLRQIADEDDEFGRVGSWRSRLAGDGPDRERARSHRYVSHRPSFRLRPEEVKGGDRFAAQAVQLADGQHRVALEMRLEGAELEGRAAEAA
jgi:hypothetical protein